jgi:glycosyltransferase involved in cell wall biosynthesis
MIYTHAEEERLACESVAGLPRGYVAPLGADVPPDGRTTLAEEFFERFPHLAGRPLVLFLSRLHEKKGLDLLIPAFQRVRAQLPDAHLVVVGGGAAAYEEQLRSWVRERKLEAAVTLTGNLSGRDKWIAIAAATLFVLPSYQENFALVVADALALGVPVVLSDRVNIHDDITAAGAGVVCDLNADDIAEKIVAALGNPESLARAGEAGIRLVAEKFTWRGCAERLLEAYHDVLHQQVRT